jgi:hypothetical protein
MAASELAEQVGELVRDATMTADGMVAQFPQLGE